MSDESIHVADVSQGQAGASEDDPGESVELPVVDLLTGRGFVTGKSGGGKSILEGTPVHTESGRRPIEEVTRGDSVLSLNTASYEQEYREVKQQIEHVDDQLVEITLEDGTQVVGTEDHSFLTADGLDIEPVRGEHVEPGVWMPVARSLPSTGSVTEVDLEQYVMGDSGLVAPAQRDDHRSSRGGDDTLVLGFDVGWEIGLFLGANGRTDDETVRIESPTEAVESRLQDRNYDISTAPAVKSDRGLAGLLSRSSRRQPTGRCPAGFLTHQPTFARVWSPGCTTRLRPPSRDSRDSARCPARWRPQFVNSSDSVRFPCGRLAVTHRTHSLKKKGGSRLRSLPTRSVSSQRYLLLPDG
jgi:Protein of unknown function (DUF1557).